MDIQTESILQGSRFKKLLDGQNVELKEKYGLKRAELEVLYFLSRCGSNNTSSDIHYQLMMNKGHISQAVDSLCRRGLVIAVPDEADRRYIHYEVSDSAQEIIDEMDVNREKMTQQIFDGISEEELKTFREVAVKIGRNMAKLL